MRMFDFDPSEYASHFAEHGWAHIRGGQDPRFHAQLRSQVDERLGAHRVEGATIGGQKQQDLYEFPPQVDFPGELFDVVSRVCGLNRETMTLSERHIKAYHDDVAAQPVPHKDRFASQVAVGLSISIPRESYLVLYPGTDRGRTPFNVSTHMRSALPPEERPESLLGDAARIEIDDSDGDVTMFLGSAIWHVRHNAAGARNLYLKLNDFDSDPLGEDPSTLRRRERTMQLLAGGDRELAGARPVLARRFESVTEHHSRLWDRTTVAEVWGQAPVPLERTDLRILRSLEDHDLEGLADALADHGIDRQQVAASVRRLAERGVLDLIE